MNKSEENIVHNLEDQKDVQEALHDVLEHSTDGSHPKTQAISTIKDKIQIIVYVGIIIFFTLVHYAFHLDQLPIEKKYLPMVPKLVIGVNSIALTLFLAKLIKIYFINGIKDLAEKHNLVRLLNMAAGLILFFIGLSAIYANWYTAVVSLGLMSVILGFALQTPILSFIGWIYIIVRKPYKLGDVIKVGDDTGEVIDIDYLDSTLWELTGDALNSNRPTGRIIRFPNSNLLNASVFNYSWALFPYIFDEITFYVAFDSDFANISSVVSKIVSNEIGKEQGNVNAYKELLKRARITTDNFPNTPDIGFKPYDNMWIQVGITYAVLPIKAGEIKSSITHKILEQLNQKGNSIFPLGNNR